MSTYHPAITSLPDDHDTIYHGVVGPWRVDVEVGPQFDDGEADPSRPVAHVHVHYDDRGGYGLTTDDPEVLAEVGRVLLSASHALRDRQAAAR